LLDFFTLQRPEIGLSDLSRLSAMNKATVFRLVSELQAHGFLEQSHTRSYRLGPATLRLASVREATQPMRAVAMDVLRDLAAATDETAHVSHLQGNRLVTLAYAYAPTHGTAVRMEDAEFIPFHATSTGHAVLAFADPAFTARILATPLPAITPDTITDPATIRSRLKQIRATGMAEVIGGLEPDVHSLATPLFDASATCIGAVAVAAPTSRMNDNLRNQIANALHNAAHRIVMRWGGQMPKELYDFWAADLGPLTAERTTP